MYYTTNSLLKFHQKLTSWNLEVLWEHVRRTNPCQDTNYHNNPHMFVTALMTDVFLNQYDVPLSDRIHAVAAQLLHDYDHSQGAEDDRGNIARARMAWQEMVHDKAWLLPKGLDADRVDDLIARSEYPHQPIRDIVDGCMHDADMIYAQICPGVEVIMEHLRAELEVTRQARVTYQEMAENQRKFLSQLSYHTPQAQELTARLRQPHLDACYAYARAFGGINNH